jgi:hypothetical protein
VEEEQEEKANDNNKNISSTLNFKPFNAQVWRKVSVFVQLYKETIVCFFRMCKSNEAHLNNNLPAELCYLGYSVVASAEGNNIMETSPTMVAKAMVPPVVPTSAANSNDTEIWDRIALLLLILSFLTYSSSSFSSSSVFFFFMFLNFSLKCPSPYFFSPLPDLFLAALTNISRS